MTNDPNKLAKQLAAENDPKKAQELIEKIAKTVSTDVLEKVQKKFEELTEGKR